LGARNLSTVAVLARQPPSNVFAVARLDVCGSLLQEFAGLSLRARLALARMPRQQPQFSSF